jgi:peptide/nickel transport system substrate-binding protein
MTLSRLTRRHVNLGLAALAVTPARAAASLGTVTMATAVDLQTLDGTQNVTTYHRIIFKHLYDPLLTFDPDFNLIPGLAERWEQVDPLTWRFHLRQGVTFHNGEKFTAEAVKFGLIQSRRPTAQSRNTLGIVKDFNIHDDHTIDLITEVPLANALAQLADTVWAVAPGYYQQVGPEEFSRAPVGTGPYKFESWRRGDRITFARFDGWWKGTPKADKVVFWAVPEASTRVAAVLSGDADIAWQVPPIQTARVKNSSAASIVSSVAGVQPIYGGIMYDRPPFNDVRVRQALNCAINKQGIVDRLLQGYGKPMGQFSPTGTMNYNPEVLPYPYDPARARALLKEAGVDGLKLSIEAPIGIVPQASEVCQVIAQNLAQVGVTATIKLDEYPVFAQRQNDFAGHQAALGDIFLMYYKAGPTAAYTVSELTNTAQGWDWNHYADARVDELWKLWQGEFDAAKSKSYLMEIEKLGHDDAAWLFLYEPQSLWAIGNRLTWAPRNDDMIHAEDLVPRSA